MSDLMVRLIAKLDANQTKKDIKKIEQQLNKKGIKLKTALNTSESKQEVNKLIKELQSVLSQNGLTVNTSAIQSAIHQLAEETPKIFNTSELDTQGKIYVQKVSNTIEKANAEIASKLKSPGNSFEEANKSANSME